MQAVFILFYSFYSIIRQLVNELKGSAGNMVHMINNTMILIYGLMDIHSSSTFFCLLWTSQQTNEFIFHIPLCVHIHLRWNLANSWCFLFFFLPFHNGDSDIQLGKAQVGVSGFLCRFGCRPVLPTHASVGCCAVASLAVFFCTHTRPNPLHSAAVDVVWKKAVCFHTMHEAKLLPH